MKSIITRITSFKSVIITLLGAVLLGAIAYMITIDWASPPDPAYILAPLACLCFLATLAIDTHRRQISITALAGLLFILAPPSCESLPAWAKTEQAKATGRVLTSFAIRSAASALSESNPAASAILLAGLRGVEATYSNSGKPDYFDADALQFEADLEATLAAESDPAKRQALEDQIALALAGGSK